MWVRLARAPVVPTSQPEGRLDPGPLVGTDRRDAVAEALAGLPVAGALSRADDLTGAFLVPLGLSKTEGTSGLTIDPTGAGVGMTGKATFMGVEAVGRRFLIIADRSSSMSGQKFTRVCAEISQTIRGLKPNARFYVVFYDSSALPYPESRWLSGRRDAAALLQWMGGLGTSGGTEPLSAFQFAFNQLRPRPDAIFFMTDGLFGADLATVLPTLNVGRRPVPIHTISFVDRSAEGLLRQIAHDSKGTYRHVDLTP